LPAPVYKSIQDEYNNNNQRIITYLREESVERIITTADGFVRGHLAVRLDTVLQAVQLPAGITNLDTGLTDVD
jgi:hypothetical protein